MGLELGELAPMIGKNAMRPNKQTTQVPLNVLVDGEPYGIYAQFRQWMCSGDAHGQCVCVLRVVLCSVFSVHSWYTACARTQVALIGGLRLEAWDLWKARFFRLLGWCLLA